MYNHKLVCQLCLTKGIVNNLDYKKKRFQAWLSVSLQKPGLLLANSYLSFLRHLEGVSVAIQHQHIASYNHVSFDQLLQKGCIEFNAVTMGRQLLYTVVFIVPMYHLLHGKITIN